MKKKYNVLKASGESVSFSPEKLQNSLRKSGASDELINLISYEIENDLYEGISTKKIYRKAFSMLKSKKLRPILAKYTLKQSIMELGPSGYPFENYVAQIFKHQGFSAKVGQVLKGHCVNHEVDVFAENESKVLFIECKYHKNPGYKCDVKIPLYIHSRFRDLEKAYMNNKYATNKSYEGWLVTNTKFSLDAIQYGNCAGLKLLGWDYPEHNSLKKLIDHHHLYPLTTLSTLKKNEKEQLLEMKVVLCRELLDDHNLLKKISLSSARIKEVLDECYKLAGNL